MHGTNYIKFGSAVIFNVKYIPLTNRTHTQHVQPRTWPVKTKEL